MLKLTKQGEKLYEIIKDLKPDELRVFQIIKWGNNNPLIKRGGFDTVDFMPDQRYWLQPLKDKGLIEG